jgi:hypothetical protein
LRRRGGVIFRWAGTTPGTKFRSICLKDRSKLRLAVTAFSHPSCGVVRCISSAVKL